MLPSLLTGPTHGASYFYNVHWFEAFTEQLYAGEIYPRWLAPLWDGAGSADFIFLRPRDRSVTAGEEFARFYHDNQCVRAIDCGSKTHLLEILDSA
jgi:hypothetical protein